MAPTRSPFKPVAVLRGWPLQVLPHPGSTGAISKESTRRGCRGHWIQGRGSPVKTRFRIRRFVLHMAQNLLPASSRSTGNSVPDRLSRTALGSLRACDLDRSQPAQTIASGLISPTACAVSSRPAAPANQPFALVLRYRCGLEVVQPACTGPPGLPIDSERFGATSQGGDQCQPSDKSTAKETASRAS